MVKKIFSFRTESVVSSAFLLVLSTLASRLLGLVRDRLLASRFGAGEELDIYFAAFRIPDFVYALLITGGISAVFLPVFSEVFQRNHEEGWRFANNIINVFLAGLIVLCAILALATPWIIHLIVPGFSPENKAMAASLTRIMFLSPILFGLASIFSSVLHYFQKFLVYSLAPILYNAGIIIGILFFLPSFGLRGLAYGVILGAFLYFLVQIPAAMHSGWRYRYIFQIKQNELLKTFRLMVPRILGTSAYQFNLLFITAFASTLGVGAIAVFNFANNLQYFPIGLVGVSFAMAVFPVLSQSWAEKNKEKFLDAFSSTARQILFLIIPMSVLIFLLRAHVVRLILGTGQFGWLETRLTAASLGVFSMGIFAASLVPLAARAFFSLQDTKTPALIGAAAVVLNIVFSFAFVWLLSFSNVFSQSIAQFLDIPDITAMSIIALPFAISLSTILQLFLLVSLLRAKIGDFRPGTIALGAKKMIIAGISLALAVYATLQVVAPTVNVHTFFGIFLQTLLAGGVGIAVYFSTAFYLKIPETALLASSILRFFGRAKKGVAVSEIPLA